jgi:outer membrane protein assembly factor BamB
MPTEIFSIPGQFTVFRAEDGAFSWSGNYRAMKIVAALPIDGERCLILLDTAASKEKVFENLLCVDCSGSTVWKAALPDQPDAFVKFEMTVNELCAWTWSGWALRLEPATGKILERHFVK